MDNFDPSLDNQNPEFKLRSLMDFLRSNTGAVNSAGVDVADPATDAQGASVDTPPEIPPAASAGETVDTGTTIGGDASTGAADWRVGLDPSIKDNPVLNKFKTLEEIPKAYVEIQKLIGKEKIALPSENATKEEWSGVFNALGRPATADGYKLPEVSLPEGTEKNPELDKAFIAKSHELGLLPGQLEGIYKWYAEEISNAHGQGVQARDDSLKTAETTLRKEWGNAYEQNITVANKTVQQFGGNEAMAVFEETGLGNHPVIIKLFSKIGKSMSEDGIIGEGALSTHSPQEALDEIKKIQGDTEHPYYKRSHPEHSVAVEKMKNLFKAAYPNERKA